jgi:hypothetical protein
LYNSIYLKQGLKKQEKEKGRMFKNYCTFYKELKKRVPTLFLLSLLLPVSVFAILAPLSIDDERAWLEKTYLPALHGSVFYIGVGNYTATYHTRVQNPELFETIDCVEERAPYGSPFKHYIGDFMQFSSLAQYDNVSLFGILGFSAPYFTPFRTHEQILKALDKIDSLVKTNGTLQVSGQIGGTPYLIEGQDSEFWLTLFSSGIFKIYKTIACLISPQNVIWWGQKIENEHN